MDEEALNRIRDEIVAEIEKAFDGVERGNGVTLHEAWEIDCGRGERARARARRKDTESRWQDVPEEDIEENPSALSFMDAEGFRYYIPAFMTWTLRHYRDSDSLSGSFTISAFALERRATDEYGLLSVEQRRVICRFLRYFAQNDEGHADSYQAGIALKMGWEQYCE